MALLQSFISISHAIFGNWLTVLITTVVGYLLYRGVFGSSNSRKRNNQRKLSKEKPADYEIVVGGDGEMQNKVKMGEARVPSVDEDNHHVSVENEETTAGTAKLSEELQLPPHLLIFHNLR